MSVIHILLHTTNIFANVSNFSFVLFVKDFQVTLFIVES